MFKPTFETAPGITLRLQHTLGRSAPAVPVASLLGWSPDVGGSSYRVLQRSAPGRVRTCDIFYGNWRSDLPLSGGTAVLGVGAGESWALVYTECLPSEVRSLALWDVVSGLLVAKLRAPPDAIEGLAASSDGRTAVASAGASVFVYDLPLGEPVAVLSAQGPVAVSADGTMLVARSPDGLHLLVTRVDGSLRAELVCPHDAAITAVAFSTDGSRIVAGASDGSCVCWEIASGRRMWRSRQAIDPVVSLDRSPRGDRWVSLDSGGLISAFSLGGESAWQVQLPADSGSAVAVGCTRRQVLVSPNGEHVAVLTAPSVVQALMMVDGRPPGVESSRDDRGVRLALSADGRLVACGGTDEVVRVDDVAAGQTLWTFETGADEVTAVEFLPDGSGIRTCGTDGFVRRWNLATGAEDARWSTGHNFGLKTVGSLDGSRVLVTNGHVLELWSDRAPERVVWRRRSTNGHFTLPCFCDAHAQVLFINDGMTNEGSYQERCWPLDVATGESVAEKARFIWHQFITMQETRRGPLSLSHLGGADYRGYGPEKSEFLVIEEWSPRRRQSLQDRGRSASCACFSIDGRRLATAHGSHVDLFQLLPMPTWIGTVDLSSLGDRISTLAVSDDGSVVAVGTKRGRVLVFVVEGPD